MTICNLDGANPLHWNSWRTSVRRCPGVRDNCNTLNTKTGYDDDDEGYNLRSIEKLTFCVCIQL